MSRPEPQFIYSAEILEIRLSFFHCLFQSPVADRLAIEEGGRFPMSTAVQFALVMPFLDYTRRGKKQFTFNYPIMIVFISKFP